jgi:hypothetical protein
LEEEKQSSEADDQETKIGKHVAGVGNAEKDALVGEIMIGDRLMNRTYQGKQAQDQSST